MGFVDGSKRPEQNVGRKPMRFASPFAMADNKNDGRWLPTPKEDSVSSPRFSKPCAEVDSVLALSPINAHDVIGKPKHAEPAALLSDGCSRSTHLELAAMPARTPFSWPVIIQNGRLISNSKLPFYPPQSVDGEVASISPPLDVIHQSKEAWGNTLFGYFTDKSPHFLAVSKIARHLWARFGICHVAETANGFFLFRFSSDAHLEDCLARGPWAIGGKPLFLKRWQPGMAMIKENHQTIQMWITLRNVPAEYWTPLGLSWIASAVGKPLHLDANTAKLERMHFARVCVEVRIDAAPPTKIKLTSGITSGEESVVEVVVEFQWNHMQRKSCWTNGKTIAQGITLMESRPTRWKLDNFQSRLAPPSSKRNKPKGLKQCSLRACSSPEAPRSSHTRDLASYYIVDEALLNPITATSGNASLSPDGKDSESASSPLNVEGKQGDCNAVAIASISSANFLKRGILSKEVFEHGTCEAPKLPITDANRLDVLGGSYCHEGTIESSSSGFATNSLEALPTEGPGVTDDIKKQSGILLSQVEYKTFPIWITLSNVPVEFWSPLGLSWIASVVGKPIQLDPITKRMERMSFARICVEVGIEANLPSKVCIRNPTCPDQSFTEISIDYQWKLVRCGS